MLFNFHVVILFLLISFSVSDFYLHDDMSEKMLEIISILLNILSLILCPSMWSVLETMSCVLEKNVCSGFVFYVMS